MRVKRKMSPSVLAATIGVSRMTMWRIEKGTAPLGMVLLKKIAKVLDCKPSELADLKQLAAKALGCKASELLA